MSRLLFDSTNKNARKLSKENLKFIKNSLDFHFTSMKIVSAKKKTTTSEYQTYVALHSLVYQYRYETRTILHTHTQFIGNCDHLFVFMSNKCTCIHSNKKIL